MVLYSGGIAYIFMNKIGKWISLTIGYASHLFRSCCINNLLQTNIGVSDCNRVGDCDCVGDCDRFGDVICLYLQSVKLNCLFAVGLFIHHYISLSYYWYAYISHMNGFKLI
eukprot:466030_1